MAADDIRWRQRFDNVQRALLVSDRGVQLAQVRELSELARQDLIQGFASTHALAWNLQKDYLTCQGIASVVGSRDATRLAFQTGLIRDGETWMEMIRSRNQLSHNCNLAQAQAIAHDVIERFYLAFTSLQGQFLALAEEPS